MSRGRAALAVLLSFIAGIGLAILVGSDDEQGVRTVTSTAARPASGPAEATLRVAETDYRLHPATPDVRAARVIALLVKNRGGRSHALAVETPHGTVRTRTLAPGAATRLKVDLPPGRYTWYCPIDDHQAKGMNGTLVVRSPRRLLRMTKTVEAPTTRERTVKTVTAPPRTETKTVTTTKTVTAKTTP